MEEKNLFDSVVDIATILTPVLLLIISVLGWKYQASITRQLKIEERLRDDQIKAYEKMLHPFIVMLSSDAAWETDPETKGTNKQKCMVDEVLSLKYRENAFRLSLIGSDAVVRAFNNLMQHSYSLGENEAHSDENITEIISLLGNLLLEIRKSMGNEDTKIDKLEILEWFMKDVRKFRK